MTAIEHGSGTAPPAAALTRTQNRLLRRIYNGRTIPLIADGRPFLTYKDAVRYLASLAPDDRDRVYAAMKEHAKLPRQMDAPG